MALDDTLEREPETSIQNRPSEMDSLRAIAHDPSNAQITNPEFSAPSRVSNVQKTYKSGPENHVSGRMKTAGTAAQIGGGVAQGAGTIVQGTGKIVSGASKAAAAIPIVGAPVAAVGTGIGKSLELGGKGIRKGAKKVTKKGTEIKRSSRLTSNMSTKKLVAKSVNTRYNPLVRERMNRLTLGSTEADIDKAKVKSRARWLVPIGWFFSFVVSVANALFIYFFYAYLEVQDGGLWDITKSAVTLNFSEAATKTAIYFYPEELLGLIVAFWVVGFVFAGTFLFIAYKAMQGSGAETKNTAVKEGLFLAAFVAVFIPMINVWPWANSWIKHVAKHPE